ncbi:uncharacterized protein A4U43_C01F800 [Asparagus officinalis]|uniref:Reticulon-like protein n=1 Tax=Asparagus officinalis TaxID=4686 RepID=A0A5P1FQF4_ASPOF|nr:reticulon-like protein B21 isoform X2 [Asparagus officinalis]ONK78900.1 uncharacterized protein A4U43_C01F800 [Asparagus officinalis]
MQPGAKRRARSNNGGSVWENRMKMDQVKGGVRVFSGGNGSNAGEEGVQVHRRLRRNQSEGSNGNSGSVEGKKRRNWKPPEPADSIQLRKSKSELSNSSKVGSNGEDEEEEDDDDEIEIEGEVKGFDDKEIDLPVEKSKPKMVVEVGEEKRVSQVNEIPIAPEIGMKENPEMDLKEMEPDPLKPQPIEVEEEMLEIGSETQNRMQNIVDLVMWRDISRSAFVFGLGTFILLSSSYTKDIDFSLLSAISYLGLVYLALVFLYNSILRRGDVEFEERCLIGEEEAAWALRFLLPYINEVLIKIKALFSGDPSTTMKMAVLLFVMARCGSSITAWTLAKLVFFGIFTIPKIFSSYSLQLAKYGKFWMERFEDGWESCTHKKAVAAAVFVLIWNISSTVARIWAVFMLVVAVKFYQQCAAEWSSTAVNDEQQQHEEQGGRDEIVAQRAKRQEDSKAVGPSKSPSTSLLHRQQGNGPKREATKVKRWT